MENRIVLQGCVLGASVPEACLEGWSKLIPHTQVEANDGRRQDTTLRISLCRHTFPRLSNLSRISRYNNPINSDVANFTRHPVHV